MNIAKKLSLTYAAGSFGGLVNGLAVWLFGYLKITAAVGVNIAPALTASMIYPRLVWGGLWGFLFLLPLFRNSPLLRGIIFSLGPTLIQLFVVFPAKTPNAFLGLHLGNLTPLFVVIFNIFWGVAASYWLHRTEEKARLWR